MTEDNTFESSRTATTTTPQIPEEPIRIIQNIVSEDNTASPDNIVKDEVNSMVDSPKLSL